MSGEATTGLDSARLVSDYREAATQHGIATASGDPVTANGYADRLAEIYSELRGRGYGAQSLLIPLLDDPQPGVRLWAASHALDFASPAGERTLIGLAADPGFINVSAEATLQEWRAGRLKFP